MPSTKLEDVLKRLGHDVGRLNIHVLPPEALVRITDPNAPGYDPRVHDEPTDAGVDQIAQAHASGTIPVLFVRRNGTSPEGTPILEIIDGRDRHAAATECNRRIATGARQGSPVKLPVRLVQIDDADLALVALAANTSKPETPHTLAVKVRIAVNNGKSHAQLAKALRMALKTVEAYACYLDLAPAAREVFDRGVLPMSAAATVAEVPRDEQPTVVERLVEAGATRTHQVEAAVKTAREGKPVVPLARMLSRRQIDAISRHYSTPEVVVIVLRFVLGDRTALDHNPRLKAVIDEALASSRDKS